MSENTSLSDLSIEELKERKEELSGEVGIGTDHIDEELSEREQQRQKEQELLDLKTKLAEAKEAGLEDDLVVERIEDRIEDLASDLDQGPRAELAAETGVDRSVVADMDPDAAEAALEHLDALERMEGARDTDFKKMNQESHREDLAALLPDGGVEATALEAAYLSDDTGGDAAAALAETDTSGGDASTDSSTGGAAEVWAELAEETNLTESEARNVPVHDAKRALRYIDRIERTSSQDRVRSEAARLAEVSDKAGVDLQDLLPDGVRIER